MLAFALAIQGTTVNSIDPMNFFSCNAPELITEASLTHLQSLPMPTPLTVGQLVKLQGQAWLDGFQSIRYMHLSDAVTSHFPFWLVSFWAAALDLCKKNLQIVDHCQRMGKFGSSEKMVCGVTSTC
jgi:hypothetical protein